MSSDSERLERLARALTQADGKRVKLPVVPHADAAAMVAAMHAQLDDAIARRDAEIGERMACRMGCNACCTSPVLATEGEAIAIAAWLREHPEARAQFEAAYVTWRAALGELVEQTSARSAEENAAWMARMQQRHVMCAFNQGGACSVYAARPAVCRRTHALDTNEHCTSETVPARYYEHPEAEAVYDGQRPLRFALHKALRPGSRLELVCASVHRLLGEVSRNAPCPCGSGKKYKRCCA